MFVSRKKVESRRTGHQSSAASWELGVTEVSGELAWISGGKLLQQFPLQINHLADVMAYAWPAHIKNISKASIPAHAQLLMALLLLARALSLANVQLEPGVLAPVVAQADVGWVELCQIVYHWFEPIDALALGESGKRLTD